MELYRLSYDFTIDAVIEDYESYIWTERWGRHGDLKLIMPENYRVMTNLKNYQYYGLSESKSVMMRETLDRPDQTPGADKITVSGNSLEAFFKNRSDKYNNKRNDQTVYQRYGPLIRTLIDYNCIDPDFAGEKDLIPQLEVGYVTDYGPIVQVVLERGNIYDNAAALAKLGNVDFKIRRTDEPDRLILDIQGPFDRSDPTSSVFREYSLDSGNLIEVNTVESIANYKNHARVLGKKTGVDVYLPETDENVNGFDRRTLLLEFNDIGDDTTTEAEDKLKLSQKGMEALLDENNRYIYAIDGAIPQNAWNDTYFNLGDIVMVRDTFGRRVKSQITEVIYSSDSTGQKIYPTFEAV